MTEFRNTACSFLLLVLALALVLVFLSAVAFGQTSPVRPSDAHALRSVRDVTVSPDARLIVYTETDASGAGLPSSRLLLFDRDSMTSRNFRASGRGGSHPRFSPDGERVAFFGEYDGSYGLVVADTRGSSERFLAPVAGTNHPLPSSGERLSWAPDSESIAFVSSTEGPEAEEANGDPVVIRRYLYKPTAAEGRTRFNDNRRTHVFLAELATGSVRQLTSGPHYEHSVDFSPLGDEVLFVSNREPNPDRFFNYDIFAVRVEDATVRRLTKTENAEYRPRWSPDGRRIAYQGTTRGLTSSETTMEDTHIWLMNADGSDRKELSSLDNRQGGPVWAADGNRIYFTVQERGSVRLYAASPDNGETRAVLSEAGRVGSFAVAVAKEDTNTIAYAFHGTDDLSQLHVRDSGEPTSVKLTHSNRELLQGRTIADVVALEYRSFDGTPVEAFLTMPLGRSEGSSSRHPLIAKLKGGPHSQSGPQLDLTAQVYAGLGWATLQVNYRGSTGYGQGFADAIFGDQNGGEAKDVLYGVDAALRRYDSLDRNKLGIEGGSYGGQLTNWIVTQTDRFRAAIPRAGISNLISFNYMAYYHDYLAVEFGAFPHQDDLMDTLWERSPLKHVAKVRTPVLFLHGENDNDVPIAEAEQFYIALHDVGVETVMVRYPREGHGIRETAHVVDVLERSIDWYRRHFDGAMP